MAILDLTPDFSIPTRIIFGCAVYGWRRGHEYLYIGQSINLIKRFRNHHVIREKDTKIDDTIDVFLCSRSSLGEFERAMIDKYRPLYNRDSISRKRGSSKPTRYNTFREAAESKSALAEVLDMIPRHKLRSHKV